MLSQIRRIYHRYRAAFFALRRAKLVWRRPTRSKVLIYDRGFDTDILFEYIEQSKSSTLCIRGEEFNVPVLLLSAFSMERYINIFINLTKPDFVVTFLDNSEYFYRLKNKHTDITFIFLQNGLRTKFNDIFETLDKSKHNYKVDYMLTFNHDIGNEYCKFIQGKAIPVGSVRNNLLSSKQSQDLDQGVLYVSAFKPYADKASEHWATIKGKSIQWKVVFEAEKLLVEYLSRYCADNNKKLTILARNKKEVSLEYDFYQLSVYKGCKWIFVPNSGKAFSYNVISNAKFIAGVDSTLLFESFGIGKRVAFFTCRGETVGADIGQFGWPFKFEDHGPFWSNQLNKYELYRVMDYIMSVGDVEWEEVHRKYSPHIMNYDPGNKKLISLFRDLKIPIRANV